MSDFASSFFTPGLLQAIGGARDDAAAGRPSGSALLTPGVVGAVEAARADTSFEGLPVQPWEYDLITKNIASAEDPDGQAWRWANAIQYSRIYGKPLKETFNNLEAYNLDFLGKSEAPKTAFKAVVDSYKIGELYQKMNAAGNRYMLSGGTDEAAMAEYDAFEREAAGMADNVQNRSLVTEAFKMGAQSMPYMIESAIPGLVAGIGAAALSGGALSGVALAAIYKIGSAYGSAQGVAGLEYMRMRKNGVDHDTAAGFAVLSAGLQGTLEVALGADAALGNLLTKSELRTITAAVSKKILAKGLIPTVALRAGTRMVGTTFEEGIEEGAQQIVSSVADYLAAEVMEKKGVEVKRDSLEAVVQSVVDNAKAGALAAPVFGLLGLPFETRADYRALKDLAEYAKVSSRDDFKKAAEESPEVQAVLSHVPDDQKATALDQVWQNAQAQVRKDEKGKAAPAGAPARLEGGALHTAEETVHESETGTVDAILKAGDPTTGDRYGFLRFEIQPAADGSRQILLKEANIKPEYRDIGNELLLELAAKHPGMSIVTNDGSNERAKMLAESMAAANPRGSEAGPQWFPGEGSNLDDQARARFRAQVIDAFPKMSSAQIEVGLSLHEARANAMGLGMADYLGKHFQEKMFSRDEATLQTEFQAKRLAGEETGDEAKAGIAFDKDAKALIYATRRSNFKSFAHESSHAWRRQTVGTPLGKKLDSLYGVVAGTWTRQQEEQFTDDFLRWASYGEVRHEGLRGIFEQLGKWLAALWDKLKGRSQVSPEIAEAMNELFASEKSPLAAAKAAQGEGEQVETGSADGEARAEAPAPGNSGNQASVEDFRAAVKELEHQVRHHELVNPGTAGLEEKKAELAKYREALAKAERAAEEAIQEDVPEVSPTTALSPDHGIQEVRVADIHLSEDVPNFKEGANSRTGAVEPLAAARYERLGTAPIVVWERQDGRLEVITGRHRLDLARRLGETFIPAQVVREADGFTKAMAMIFDAEANIRDGQGSVRDYANYFRNSDLSESEASSRGLLARDKGRAGFAIGRYAGDGLLSLFRSGQIGEKKAAAIAEAAPNNEALQAVGIRKARDFSAEELFNYVSLLGQSISSDSASQLDMFGNDDSLLIEAEKIAKEATKVLDGLRNEESALKGALRLGKADRAAVLDQYGVKAGDEEAIRERLAALESEVSSWEDWATDAGKVRELRKRLGLPVKDEAEPTPELQNSDDSPLLFERDDLFAEDDLSEAAVRTFGRTMNPAEAGYVLPDGRMIDFSGKNQLGKGTTAEVSGGTRRLNHESIAHVPGISKKNPSIDFMTKTGAIRVDFERGAAYSIGIPTRDAAATVAAYAHGPFTLHIDDEDGGLVGRKTLAEASPYEIALFYDSPTKPETMSLFTDEELGPRVKDGQALLFEGEDRRNEELRNKLYADMTEDERRRAVLESEIAGIPNRRAYFEDAKRDGMAPVQVSIDADSLKWINDNLGHEAGDELLKRIGEALTLASEHYPDLRAYHFHGDEFALTGKDEETVLKALNNIDDYLGRQRIEGAIPDAPEYIVAVEGLRISSALDGGGSLERADERLGAEKQRRESTGERAGRGDLPPQVNILQGPEREHLDRDRARAAIEHIGELRAQARREAKGLAGDDYSPGVVSRRREEIGPSVLFETIEEASTTVQDELYARGIDYGVQFSRSSLSRYYWFDLNGRRYKVRVSDHPAPPAAAHFGYADFSINAKKPEELAAFRGWINDLLGGKQFEGKVLFEEPPKDSGPDWNAGDPTTLFEDEDIPAQEPEADPFAQNRGHFTETMSRPGEVENFLASLWDRIKADYDPVAQEEGKKPVSAVEKRLASHPFVLGAAITVGRNQGNLAPSVRRAVLSSIRKNELAFKELYAEVMHDADLAQEARAERQSIAGPRDIKNPRLRGYDDMTLGERTAVLNRIRDSKVRARIENDEITDQEIADYIKRLEDDRAKLAEKGKQLEHGRERNNALWDALKSAREEASLNAKTIAAEIHAMYRLRDMRKKLLNQILEPPSKRMTFEYKSKIRFIQEYLQNKRWERERTEAGGSRKTGRIIEPAVMAMRFSQLFRETPGLDKLLSANLVSKINDLPVSDWSVNDLKTLLAAVEAMRKMGAMEYSMKETIRKKANLMTRTGIAQAARAMKGYNKPLATGSENELELIHKLDDTYTFAFTTANMDRIAANYYDRGDPDKRNWNLLVREELEHYRKKMENVERRKRRILLYMREKKMTPSSLYRKITVEGAGPYDSKAVFSASDLMMAMAAMRNPDSYGHFVYGNLFDPQERKNNEAPVLKLMAQSRVHAVNLAIQNELTQDEKVVAEMIAADFDREFDRLNKAVIEMTEEELAKVDHYIPIKTVGAFFEKFSDEIVQDLFARNGISAKAAPAKGFTKKRIKISPRNQSPMKLDLWGTFLDAVDKQEHLIEYGEYHRRLVDVYASRQADQIRDAIKHTYGKIGLDYLDRYIAEVANPIQYKDKDYSEKILRQLRGSLATGYLGFRWVSVVNQLVTSPMPYLAYAPGHLVASAAQSVLNPVKFVQEVEAMSIVLRNRQMDPMYENIKHMGREGLEGITRAVGEIGMKGLEWVDRYSVAIGWKAVYDKARAQGIDHEEAVRKADSVTLKCQPSARGVDLSPLFRDNNEWKKVLTQFGTQLNVVWQQMAFDIPAALREKRFGEFMGIITGMAISGLGMGLIRQLRGKDQPDDEDEAWRTWLYYGLSQGPDSIPLFGSLVSATLKRLVTGNKRSYSSDDNLPVIGGLLAGVEGLADGKVKGLKSLAEAIGLATGLPVLAIEEYLSALIERLSAED